MVAMALEELIVDVRDIDRELVSTLLAPYLRIDCRSGDVVPLAAWNDVPNEVRVLLYLLARRAMRALELEIARASASPSEIERATGIPGGSVRPALKRLLKARAVARDATIGYIVPNYAMGRVRDYIQQWLPSAA